MQRQDTPDARTRPAAASSSRQAPSQHAYRYAVYLAPVGAWRDVGSRWLGRDEESGAPLARAAGDDPRLDAWTEAPRHYGLHATLKPPFRLAPGADAAGLDRAMRALARDHQPFGIALELRTLRGFLAWCLAEDEPAWGAGREDIAAGRAALRALADDAVRRIDPWRAPPTQDELARRLRADLDPAQRAMLEAWGYPYVLDTFKFHITLTGNLADADLATARARIESLGAGRLDRPMPVDAVAVYVQPAPDAPFLVARHYGFDGATRDGAGACYLPPATDGAR
ncbi:hypothetical protein C7R54_27340 [Achromobacter aloeverae]|uniref:Phosphonate metabolism protein n=2 Tax=Achromobacter aloeverae TaxID=1750518 RepID=A0A4Q1HCV9_9BURK|nr:hypothetical protein C7R54_27340 [Achromobacter aloeverae]